MIKNSTAKKDDFCLKYVYLDKGKKSEVKKENPLSHENQIKLISKILDNVYNVVIDGRKEFLLSIGNGNVMHLDRLLVNFTVNLNLVFRELTDKQFQTINLPKLFEFIKTRTRFSYRESFSIFHKHNEIIIRREENEIINEIKTDYKFNGTTIDKEIYSDIVAGVNEHWMGLIPMILDHIIAGKYVPDKKNLWLLIMANSNFGKSKLFKWMENFGGSSFVDFKDLGNSGISDKDPKEYLGKMCLVVDEVLKFTRSLFAIEEYLTVRPMRNHSIKIPVGSKIMLSADGGVFNATFLEDQIKNRVAKIDLRNFKTEELGNLEISKKYGEYAISKSMEYWLYTELESRISEYEALSEMDRANKAEYIIKAIFKEYKFTAPNFFEKVEEIIYEILENRDMIDSFHQDILEKAIVRVDNRNHKGYIIQRPTNVVPNIITNFDNTLSFELQYKEISQIADKVPNFDIVALTVNGKRYRGLFVADKKKEIETVYETIDKDNNVVEPKTKLF